MLVARCGVHGRSFTLYPPGQVPYGRVAIVPMSAEGSVLTLADAGADRNDEGSGRSDASSESPPAWEGTLFGAALEAVAGGHWPRERDGLDWRQRRTQGRWVTRSAAILGVGAMVEHLRELVAARLGVPLLELREASRAYANSSCWQERAEAVVRVLARLPARRILGEQLLACGAVAGIWGRPMRWDPGGWLQALF